MKFDDIIDNHNNCHDNAKIKIIITFINKNISNHHNINKKCNNKKV